MTSPKHLILAPKVYMSNNLPLVLEPITIASNAHLLKMANQLLLVKWFSKRIAKLSVVFIFYTAILRDDSSNYLFFEFVYPSILILLRSP